MEVFDRSKIKEILKDKVIKCYQIRNSRNIDDWRNNKKLFKDTLDPFSAVLDAKVLNSSIDEWIKNFEIPRQQLKPIQKQIGSIHQEILGSLEGWENLEIGKIIDIKNPKKKMLAEVKNKHNTTKGDHKILVYDTLKYVITNQYPDYTGYFVEVLPPNGKEYNKPFTPPDNKLNGERRPENKQIRVIDGKSFYELATGRKDALRILFKEFPILIDEILTEEFKDYKQIDLGKNKDFLFNKVFST